MVTVTVLLWLIEVAVAVALWVRGAGKYEKGAQQCTTKRGKSATKARESRNKAQEEA